MMPTTLPQPYYRSPKRKRSASESDYHSPSASPPSTISVTSLQEIRVREEEDLGRYSPRAAVARRLGKLAIRGDHPSNAQIPSSNNDQKLNPMSACADNIHALSSDPDSISLMSLAVNETLSSVPGEPSKREQIDGPATRLAPSPKKSSQSSPRRRRNPAPSSKMRNQRGSPPLTSNTEENPYTWHDSEITGHNPSDPNDDGYGINGIGFKPTAAIAWARSQRRQRQVADWKNREAREARERRRERRDGVGPDILHTIQKGAIQKRVKFNV